MVNTKLDIHICHLWSHEWSSILTHIQITTDQQNPPIAGGFHRSHGYTNGDQVILCHILRSMQGRVMYIYVLTSEPVRGRNFMIPGERDGEILDPIEGQKPLCFSGKSLVEEIPPHTLQ